MEGNGMRSLLIRWLHWCLIRLGGEPLIVIVPVHTLVEAEEMLRDSETFCKTVQ